MHASRRQSLAGLLVSLWLAAGCQPKVDPRTPFDEDDPRALAGEEQAATAAASGAAATADPELGPIAVPGGGARTGDVSRDDLRVILDAGPAAFLRGLEVEAELELGKFVGWRLLRVLAAGRGLTALDLMVGDVLLAVNGRPLIKPSDLDLVWTELYAAPAIVAELRRGGVRFALRFAVTGPPLPAPARAPSPTR